MRELQKRQEIRKKLYSTPVLAVLLLVTLGLGKGAYTLLLKERSSAKDQALLSAKVSEMAHREDELKSEIQKLNTSEGIEEEIKSKYNVARAGEHVAVIVDRPGEPASTTPVSEPWFKRLWNDIIGR